MLKYVLKRVVMIFFVLLGVIVLVFTFLHFSPGDVAVMILGEQATPEEIEELREEMGLNEPYFSQLFRYIADVCRGDLGKSYINRRPVTQDLVSRFPITFILGSLGLLVSVILGIPIGIFSATRQNSAFDYIGRFLSLIFVSMPLFWEGLIMIMIFAVNLKWLPATGFYGPKYWILPVVTIGVHSIGSIMRSTRSSMLETIRQDYIRTARAKGVSERQVILRHALPNALIPIITIIGLRMGNELGGSVVTESIFAVPGLGKYIVDAIRMRDYPVVQGGVLLIAFSYSIVNLIVDVLYAYVDPRIRSQYSSKKRRRRGSSGGGGAGTTTASLADGQEVSK